MPWYYVEGQAQQGPVEVDELVRKIKEGRLGRDVQVWTEGQANWLEASKVPTLVNLIGAAIPIAPVGLAPKVAKDLPAPANARMRAMVGSEGRPGLFTSDLSVNEFLLVKQAGFDPLGLVVGSSIYHIGFQQSNWTQNQEMTVLTQAMYHARDLAMTRMEEEADALGADGVVGVRLEVGRYEWGPDLAEFVAVGTAVRSRDGQSHRTVEGKPFTSDLSGQDLFVLRQAGYAPVGLVMGNCVYHVAHQTLRQMWKTLAQNTEMTNYTQALYDARELAMARMQHEATRLKAEGVVGVNLHERSHGWESHVIEYFAVGTAVVSRGEEQEGAKPSLNLLLNDK